MEPVTHFLVGAAIGRAAFNRRTAYATLACSLAAEAADCDFLWSFAGPVAYLKHHRGITHTFLAAPLVALATMAFIWLLDRYWFQRRKKSSTTDNDRVPPVPRFRGPGNGKINYRWLFLATLTASLSHILLDFTNNYGVRPFFPFNARWYSLDLVFIAEPILWLIFALAFAIPAILNLTDREILNRYTYSYHGRISAIIALSLMAALWTLRFTTHTIALNQFNSTQVATEPVTRVALMPYPINPFRWHAIMETPHTFQTAELNTFTGAIDTDLTYNVIPKPIDTPAVEAAKQTELGRVYLDWGRWAIPTDLGPEPIPLDDPDALPTPSLPPPHTWTTVRFDDLRFQYDYRGYGLTTGPSPLTAWVYIIDNREDAGEVYGRRLQK